MRTATGTITLILNWTLGMRYSKHNSNTDPLLLRLMLLMMMMMMMMMMSMAMLVLTTTVPRTCWRMWHHLTTVATEIIIFLLQ